MPKIRSFIAINLPDEIKKEIGSLIEQLKQENPDKDIKWVNSEGIHLTLHFLGYLDEEKIEQVKKIIQEGVVDSNPVEIELKDFGGFPNLDRPRVLFISGQEKNESQSLQKIQMKIGQGLGKIGLEIDQRSWQIHFTLARLKIPTRIIIFNTRFLTQSFLVKSIDLMKSELTPHGAEYSLIEKFNF